LDAKDVTYVDLANAVSHAANSSKITNKSADKIIDLQELAGKVLRQRKPLARINQ